jgi:hypothetical protein
VNIPTGNGSEAKVMYMTYTGINAEPAINILINCFFLSDTKDKCHYFPLFFKSQIN